MTATAPDLFFTLAASLCAPVFVALTGGGGMALRGAARRDGRHRDFLWKRGLFLVALELTVVSFAWTFDLMPARIFLP